MEQTIVLVEHKYNDFFYCRLDGAKRDSLGSDVKNPIESDTDSMAEYGDGETGKLNFRQDWAFT